MSPTSAKPSCKRRETRMANLLAKNRKREKLRILGTAKER